MWPRHGFLRLGHIHMSLSRFQMLFYSLFDTHSLTHTECLFLIRSSPYFSFSWRNLFSTESWYVLSCPNNLQKNFHGRFLAAVLAYKCQHVGVFCVRSCCFCLSVHGLWSECFLVFGPYSSCCWAPECPGVKLRGGALSSLCVSAYVIDTPEQAQFRTLFLGRVWKGEPQQLLTWHSSWLQ